MGHFFDNFWPKKHPNAQIRGQDHREEPTKSKVDAVVGKASC